MLTQLQHKHTEFDGVVCQEMLCQLLLTSAVWVRAPAVNHCQHTCFRRYWQSLIFQVLWIRPNTTIQSTIPLGSDLFLVGDGVLGKMAGDLPRIRGLDLGLRERDLFLDLDFLSRDLERRGLLDRLGLLVRERVRERLYLLWQALHEIPEVWLACVVMSGRVTKLWLTNSWLNCVKRNQNCFTDL